MMYERIVNSEIMILLFTKQGITFIFHMTSFFSFLFILHLTEFPIPLFCQQKNAKKKKKKVTVGAELLNHDEICWNIFIQFFN